MLINKHWLVNKMKRSPYNSANSTNANREKFGTGDWQTQSYRPDIGPVELTGELLLCTECFCALRDNSRSEDESHGPPKPIIRFLCHQCAKFTNHVKLCILVDSNSAAAAINDRTESLSVKCYPKVPIRSVADASVDRDSNGVSRNRDYSNIAYYDGGVIDGVSKLLQSSAKAVRDFVGSESSPGRSSSCSPRFVGDAGTDKDISSESEKYVGSLFPNSGGIFHNGKKIASDVTLRETRMDKNGREIQLAHAKRTYPMVEATRTFSNTIRNASYDNFDCNEWKGVKILKNSDAEVVNYVAAGKFGKILLIKSGGAQYVFKYSLSGEADEEMHFEQTYFMASATEFPLEIEYTMANAAISLCGRGTGIVPHHAFFFIYMGPTRNRRPELVPVILMRYVGIALDRGLTKEAALLKTSTARMNMAYYLLQSLGPVLANLHRSNFIHGDIKTDNIIGDHEKSIIESGQKRSLMLSDFSLSMFAGQTKMIMCNAFRPPEVWLGYAPTTAADIWGLGCVIIDIYCNGVPTEEFRIKHSGVKLSAPDGIYQHLDRIAKAYGELDAKFVRSGPVLNFSKAERETFLSKTNKHVANAMAIVLDIPNPTSREAAFIDLLKQIMNVNPNTRMNIDEICVHRFMSYPCDD